MISIDFSVGIAVYVALSLAVILIFWIFTAKQKDKDLTLDSRYIWFCSICTYTYINTKEDLISVCPRCGNYNKKSENS
ncbi:MAG: hypothetical protein HY761_08145 [Candidatus Omnitrophica bacterium]|nr:hypothetical protein [Candidatus Omnitrophota bacterium]